MERKQIGRIGLSIAISYFTIKGYTISLPLNDTQWYDLIVEKDGDVKTVQCKCTFTERQEVSLLSHGGRKGLVCDSVLNHKKLSLLFCVNKYLECWVIPLEDIIKSGVKRSIYLRKEKKKHASKIYFDTSSYYQSDYCVKFEESVHYKHTHFGFVMNTK